LLSEKKNPQQKELSLILGIACTGCSVIRISCCRSSIIRIAGLTGWWISSGWRNISGLTGRRNISRLTRRRISAWGWISSRRRISARSRSWCWCRSRLLDIDDCCLGLLFSLLNCTDSHHFSDCRSTID